MAPTGVLVLVVVLVTISCCVASDCSRHLSRQAQEILSQDVWVTTSARWYEMPDNCPWKEELNMYAEHEANKWKIRVGQHRCKYCEKTFKSEDFLDRHMVRRHLDTVPEGANVCLADYCGVLGCSGELDLKIHKAPTAPKFCDDAVMDSNRALCLSVMASCFPPDTQLGHELHDHFETHFCQSLTCNALLDKERKKVEDDQQRLSFIMICFLLLALLIFYGGMLAYKWEALGYAGNSVGRSQGIDWPCCRRPVRKKVF